MHTIFLCNHNHNDYVDDDDDADDETKTVHAIQQNWTNNKVREKNRKKNTKLFALRLKQFSQRQ